MSRYIASIIWSILFIFSFQTQIFSEEPTETTPDYTLIDDKAKTAILTPALSERKTLKIRLKNGLEAFIISDPKTDKSGAVLSVKAGSWEDPLEYPGIAHFLEHMLFLGTKKYPNESEYSAYISENGGMSNAYTTHNYTSYMFSINNPAFAEGLDRFANFFKEPLFNPSGVSRELTAIDQEYAKNLENDDFRFLYVDKALANTEHPYHNFHIGNSKTLSYVSQDTLKEWYRKHYSANLMRLVVYSSLPVEKVRDMVVEDFKDVPNSGKTLFSTSKHLFTKTSQPEMVYIEPIKDQRVLALLWDLPEQFSSMHDTHPEGVVCSVIGHEGEESLLAELKRENLAENLKCSKMQLSEKNLQLYIEVELTDAGVKDIDNVINLLFQTIENLRRKGVPQYIFDEMKRMETINYQYQSREDAFEYMSHQADWIVYEDFSTYPENTLIINKFDPEAINALLKFITPQNARFFLVAPTSLTGVKFDKHEKWLGADYAIRPIPTSTFEKWEKAEPNPAIEIAVPNPFIPKNLELVNKDAIKEEGLTPHPEAILNNDMGKIYFAPDTRYQLPQIFWYFEIKTPQIEMGHAQKIVLADLYIKSIKDALSRISYPASVAGLDYEIERTNFGFSITVSGYSESADELFEEILKQIKNVHVTEEQFEVYKDSLKRDYCNFTKKMPIQQAFEYLKCVIYKSYATEKQKASAIKKITFEKFQEYIKHIIDQVYVEGILYGNQTKEQAESLKELMFDILQAAPYAKGKYKKPQVIILPKDENPHYWEVNTPAQGNASILAIEFPYFDFKMRAIQQLFMQAVKEPFFTTLRTKQQTGYIVSSEAMELQKQLFNLFAVQSNTHAARDLLARFELFLEDFLQNINEEVSKERFEILRQTFLEILSQPPKNMFEMGELLKKFAFEYEDFDWIPKRIAGLKAVTYEEFVEVSRKIFGRDGKQRLAILMTGAQDKENKSFSYTPVKNVNILRKISEFTSNNNGNGNGSSRKRVARSNGDE